MKLDGECPAMETAKDTIKAAIAELDRKIGEAMPHHRRTADAAADVNRTYKLHVNAKDAYTAVRTAYEAAAAKPSDGHGICGADRAHRQARQGHSRGHGSGSDHSNSHSASGSRKPCGGGSP